MNSQISNLTDLLPFAKMHFDGVEDRLECFIYSQVQVEGWLKGELLFLLTLLRNNGIIKEFDREIRIGRRRIDLSIDLGNSSNYIETKHWLIGEQKGYSYGPSFYFGDPTSVGITKDVDKLLETQEPSNRWMLLLLTANPGSRDWFAGIDKFNEKCHPRQIVSRSNPEDFPDTYFIGLLEVSKSTENM